MHILRLIFIYGERSNLWLFLIPSAMGRNFLVRRTQLGKRSAHWFVTTRLSGYLRRCPGLCPSMPMPSGVLCFLFISPKLLCLSHNFQAPFIRHNSLSAPDYYFRGQGRNFLILTTGLCFAHWPTLNVKLHACVTRLAERVDGKSWDFWGRVSSDSGWKNFKLCLKFGASACRFADKIEHGWVTNKPVFSFVPSEG